MPSTIGGINRLPKDQKRSYYEKIIPPELLDIFNLLPSLKDPEGRDLLELDCPAGSADTELALYHQSQFPDPILYGHITDTLTGQLHILFYSLNDPRTRRFNVDRLPDGTKTHFGTQKRNIPAEIAALEAGLAPGQIYQGPHLLHESILQFERFVARLGHVIYFVEPLYYHVAVAFEHHGFAYQRGQKLMTRIQAGFSDGGDLRPRLDGSTPFRSPRAAHSVRLRSWAIHDGILNHPFTDVTMYKYINQSAGVNTTDHLPW